MCSIPAAGGAPGNTRRPLTPTQPGLISGANRSTGLQKPAQRRTSTLAHAPTPHARRRHQHSRGMQRPAASRSRRPHFRVRKNAAVGQLRGFTSSPDGRCAQQGGTREATRKEKERNKRRSNNAQCISIAVRITGTRHKGVRHSESIRFHHLHRARRAPHEMKKEKGGEQRDNE